MNRRDFLKGLAATPAAAFITEKWKLTPPKNTPVNAPTQYRTGGRIEYFLVIDEDGKESSALLGHTDLEHIILNSGESVTFNLSLTMD